METERKNNELVQNIVEKGKEIIKSDKTINLNLLKITEWFLYVLGIIFLIKGFIFYSKDLFYTDNPLKFYEEHYVGGDAYNYIISAARSSAIMIKSLIWIVLGSFSIVIGRTLSVNKKLWKLSKAH